MTDETDTQADAQEQTTDDVSGFAGYPYPHILPPTALAPTNAAGDWLVRLPAQPARPPASHDVAGFGPGSPITGVNVGLMPSLMRPALGDAAIVDDGARKEKGIN